MNRSYEFISLFRQNAARGWLIIGFLIITAASPQTAPNTPSPGIRNLQSPQTQQKIDRVPQRVGVRAPSPFQIFVSHDLDSTADYCGTKPYSDIDKWYHDYVCNLRITDAVQSDTALAVACFTFILMVVGIGQLLVIGWQARIANRALVDLERARVFVETIEPAGEANRINKTLAVRGPVGFRNFIRLKNHGRTPARLIGHRIGGGFAATGPDLNTADQYPQLALVLGSAEISEPYIVVAEMNGAQLEAAQNGKGHIYIYGALAYEDIFDRPHETVYCFEWSFDEQRFVWSYRGLNKHT